MMEMGLLLGIFFMLFLTPYTLSKGIWIINYEDIIFQDKVRCAIPIYNMFQAQRMYTGGVPWIFISTMVTIVIFVVRLVEVTLPTPETVAMITIVLLVIAIVATYILNAAFVFQILHDSDVVGFPSMILMTILFPLGQYYIGNFLPRVIKSAVKEENTFKT